MEKTEILTCIISFLNHWFLFAMYLILNIFDFFTGCLKAKFTKKESSAIGEKGIIKKISYWILLFVSFLLPIGFKELGSILNINFEITELFGWFILISLMINEVRSILENLVMMGCNIPSIFTNGLEMAYKKINSEEEKNNETNY